MYVCVCVCARVCVLSTFSNIFSSETTESNESKFHMKPPRDGGNEMLFKWSRSYDRDGRHAHIWKKSKKIFFSGTKRPMTLKIGMQHSVLEYNQVYSNTDPGLTLTYFTARSNLVPYAFVWETVTLVFSETIVVCDANLVDTLN